MAGMRYAIEHVVARASGARVPLRLVGSDTPLPTGHLVHCNSLPRSAFDLPAGRFGSTANLVDCVAAAIARVTGQEESVISPVGSVVYARHNGDLLWDQVHDLDVWCYVPGEALAGRTLHRWHVALQIELHREFRRRGVRSRSTWPNRYVQLVDAHGRTRMVELKIAHLEWLSLGLDMSHLRFCGLRARRGRAYSLKPRLEWAAYSPFENHYASTAAARPFQEIVATIPADAAMRGMVFVYHENLAAGMRRLGPAHVMESHVSTTRLTRNRRGVLKKILMLSVLRRDEGMRRRTLTELDRLADNGDDDPRPPVIQDLVERLDDLATVELGAFAQWLRGEPVDVRAVMDLPLQSRQFREQPGGAQEVRRRALLDDAAL